MKRTDAQIYIVGYKEVPYGIWDNSLYTPIQVADGKQFTPVRDDTGTNIAEWNPVFAETTAHYWIWKNVEGLKYIGVCQYRRRIVFEEDYDFDKAFANCGAICSEPLKMNTTVRKQYEICHSAEDIALAEKIVKEKFPEYATSWDRYIERGNILYYSNSFLMRAEDFKTYCSFLFTVCFEYLRIKGLSTADDVRRMVEQDIRQGKRKDWNGAGKTDGALRYQTQLFGFLSERLSTLFIRHNFEGRIATAPWQKFENV